jgi:(+)-pinoresinol hydroxylase
MAAAVKGRSRAIAAVLCLMAGGALLAACSAPDAAPVQKQALSAGAKTYEKWCRDCHGTLTGPGSMALQRKYKGNPVAILDQRTDMSADYIKAVTRQGVSFMPSFRKTEISDSELAQLAAFITHTEGATAAPLPKAGSQ